VWIGPGAGTGPGRTELTPLSALSVVGNEDEAHRTSAVLARALETTPYPSS